MTPAQKNVLDWIRGFHAMNGRMPTQREIAEARGTSQAAVHSMLDRLEAAGAITRDKRKRRAITLVGA